MQELPVVEKASEHPAYTTIRSLEHLPIGGVEESVIEAWIEDFQKYSQRDDNDFPLMELQQLVANNEKALGQRDADQITRGPNLLITGPTSAGKTFCAEILMANHLARGTHPIGCIYAVPLRALATEKWKRFQKIFGETQVYISSSDIQQYDFFILNRRFRIAVVIYEKLYSWLTHKDFANSLLSKTALFIFDELQMLSDSQRGAKLELILTFLRDRQRHPRAFSKEQDYHDLRIIGLGAGGDTLKEVQQWLHAEHINIDDEKRPVPLIQGFINLQGEKYHVPLPQELLRSYPDGNFPLPELPLSNNRDELIENLVVEVLRPHREQPVGTGSRILIYVATKTGAETMALKIANTLTRKFGKRQEDLDATTKELIDGLEETDTLARLKETIESGVGFHHADLTLAERDLVERLFRDPDSPTRLDVIVCTLTLAMGVNLPADYMLFSTAETFRQSDHRFSGRDPEPLTPLEYKQFAGRAGRYRLRESSEVHYGVALFVTDKDWHEAQKDLVQSLILRKIDPIEPALHRWPSGLTTLALGMLAWIDTYNNPDYSPDNIKNLFASTFAGHSQVYMKHNDTLLPISEVALKTLEELAQKDPDKKDAKNELVRIMSDGTFDLPEAGKIVARQGIDIKTYRILKGIVEKLPDILEQPLVLLEVLVQATEIAKLYPTRIPEKAAARELSMELREFFAERQQLDGQSLGPIAKDLLEVSYTPSTKNLTYLMRTAAVWSWIQGDKIIRSSVLPNIRHGAVLSLTDQLSWLVSILGPLWDSLGGWPDLSQNLSKDEREHLMNQKQWDIKRLELRLRYGVPVGLEGIAQLRVKDWHRERLVELQDELKQFHSTWDHPVDLLNYSPRKLRKRKLQQTFGGLQKAVKEQKWIDDPRSPEERQFSIVQHAINIYGSDTLIDPEWKQIIRGLHHAKGQNLVQVVLKALKCKPLQMNASIGGYPQPDILLQNGSETVGIVLISSEKEIVQWSDIIQQSKRLNDEERLFNHLICLCEQTMAINTEQEHNRLEKRSLLLLSREAFAQLCISAVDDPDDGNIEESGEREREKRIPVVRLVRKLLEAPYNHALIRTSEEMDNRLYQMGKPRVRFIYQSPQLIGGRLLRPPTKDTSPLVNALLEHIREELQELQLNPANSRVNGWLQEAHRHLPKQPDRSARTCHDMLEDLLLQVYQEERPGAEPGSSFEMLAILEKSGMSYGKIEELNSIKKYLHQPSSNSLTALEATEMLQDMLYLGKWYLTWQDNIESALLVRLPAQLDLAIRNDFTPDRLRKVLYLSLQKTLSNIVSEQENFEVISEKVIKRAQSEEWLPRLIVALYKENPTGPHLRVFISQFQRIMVKWDIDVVLEDIETDLIVDKDNQITDLL